MTKKIHLKEYIPTELHRDALPEDIAEKLWKQYSNIINLEVPSFKNNRQWRLISEGWVGQIPLSDEYILILNPRFKINNLFKMWEYAYRLNSFKFLEGIVDSGSLEEFFQQLANILAKRVIDRARKGFYKCYIDENDMLPYLRGRMDIQRKVNMPWSVNMHVFYEDHTGNIEDNQILAWTMWQIARSGMCDGEVLTRVRVAYRSLQNSVTLKPFDRNSCLNRIYNRLNADYHPLHALCAFFLESTGPTHETGEKEMLPFLVNMPRLFEMFVAEWLKINLPHGMELKTQERLLIDEQGHFKWIADLIIYDLKTGSPKYVLDTKYKIGEKPNEDDIAKVLAYAESLHCRDAILIYPSKFDYDIDEIIGKIRVRSMAFSLDGDLEENGQRLLKRILEEEVIIS